MLANGGELDGERIIGRKTLELLHANFVVAVLSDLFGIQARGGCFCAGPYIHRMYPIDDEWSQGMDAEVSAGHMGAKLAFTRLSFNYFITDTVFEYIVAAVDMLATDGWKLLPLYRFDPDSGLWRHRAAGADSMASLSVACALPTRCDCMLAVASSVSSRTLPSSFNWVMPKPGLVREEGFEGPGIDIEIWAMPEDEFGSFVAAVPAPLGIGNATLEDGNTIKCFICEPYALRNATEITHFGGWRAFLASQSLQPSV